MTDATDFPARPDTLSAVIATSGTTSAAVDLKGCTLSAFQFPSSMVGTAINFQGSHDGVTYGLIRDELGAALTWTFASSAMVSNLTNYFFGVRYLKVVSNATETSGATFVLQPEYV